MEKIRDDGGRLNVRLPRAFLRRLKLECVRRGTTLQAAAEKALSAWMKRGVGR